MKIDNKNYPMVIGGEYKFITDGSFYHRKFDGFTGALVSGDIDKNEFKIKLDGNAFSWSGNYDSFKLSWRLVKE